ncbi:RDD family protein [Oceanihabitans sp. 2_MG-2023]|uniref:RDD family protein n=1 Tax=Oceanihabitans sp. 2_MG-2023 TaxID=3062661 RepID=UPI0026E33428|nr:RDD family protein [Oceanihabitans sp. 2_MG-2023]MDO6596643.1 RDD family protein [Oceanihabitans sp. 2_MG-2023]
MKRLQIKTAQNVNIHFTMANVGQRLLAFVIDNIIKFAYLYFVISFFDFSLIENTFDNDQWTIKAIDVLLFLPITFYSLYSEILLNGQTIGKKLLKIKVINEDGFKPSITDYLIRWFLRVIDFNFFSLVFIYIASLNLDSNEFLLVTIFIIGKLIGFLMILFTNKSQRLGDIMANTVVIYLKDEVKFSDTILEKIAETYKPVYPAVIKLSDNDARIIKETFINASKLNDYKTLIKLRNKILEVTEIKSTNTSDREFIDTVLKDYNYYTQNM